MAFLHPVFTITILILIGFSFLETYNNRKYKAVWIVVAIMILLIGFREWVGADYKPYRDMFLYFGEFTPYAIPLNKAVFGNMFLEVEWLYVLVGKWIYDLGLEFYMMTFVIALLSIPMKYFTFENVVAYPTLSLLLYIFPTYFTADGGQMRQAVAMAITMFSFIFIKKRQLLWFVVMIYLAYGFHKSAVIFLPAYWLVRIPFNSKLIALAIITSVFLSPFKIYLYISILDGIAPAEVYEGFSAYETVEVEGTGRFIRFTDLICIMYAYFLITYDKEACQKIAYYEYIRNIGLIGICMYFIFRGSAIFAGRLAAYYIIFMTMALPNILAAIPNVKTKKFSHLFLIGFVIFYYFTYAIMQAPRAGYNWARYDNFLW